ncbi:hypothetical protein [Streptomyces tendae]|uniref:hypothetical protein n=1 Tax=Streptomyces tendae TaxID=1932 RepID=UPI0036A6E71D
MLPYLILGHDWFMEELYASFAVPPFAERVLALSANLDDDTVLSPAERAERAGKACAPLQEWNGCALTAAEEAGPRP